MSSTYMSVKYLIDFEAGIQDYQDAQQPTVDNKLHVLLLKIEACMKWFYDSKEVCKIRNPFWQITWKPRNLCSSHHKDAQPLQQ